MFNLGQAKDGKDGHCKVKGTDRDVRGENLDLGMGRVSLNGYEEQPRSGLANGTMNETAEHHGWLRWRSWVCFSDTLTACAFF